MKVDNFHIENSKIEESVKVYNNARVVNSTLMENVVIADFARVYDSILEENTRAERNNIIVNSRIGRYTYFGKDAYVNNADIGRFCSISWGVTIGPPQHEYNRVTSHEFLYSDRYSLRPKEIQPAYNQNPQKTIIGNDVWIGADVIIMNGIKVGDGAVIGANATVTKDIPPYAIVVGSPAKVVKFRFEHEIIEELRKIKWWDFSAEFIRENFQLFALDDIRQFIKEVKNK